jgi:hypothetical protein
MIVGNSDSSFEIPPPACVKCNAAMEEGFMLDRSHGSSSVATWISGKPESSFLCLKPPAGDQSAPSAA